MKNELEIRAASDKDLGLILSLVRKLAEHEGLSDKVKTTENDLRESLFGPASVSEVMLGYYRGESVAFAVIGVVILLLGS